MRTLQALSRAGRLGVCFLAYNSQISRSRAASSSSSPAVNEPLGLGTAAEVSGSSARCCPAAQGRGRGWDEARIRGWGTSSHAPEGK